MCSLNGEVEGMLSYATYLCKQNHSDQCVSSEILIWDERVWQFHTLRPPLLIDIAFGCHCKLLKLCLVITIQS